MSTFFVFSERAAEAAVCDVPAHLAAVVSQDRRKINRFCGNVAKKAPQKLGITRAAASGELPLLKHFIT